MSYGEKILGIVTTTAGDVGELKADMVHVKAEIKKLKKKKSWAQKVDWVKAGKGIGYFILSVAVAGGGVAGISSWLGVFKP
ncbi:hypothetical protein KAR91_17010 [Candidatus Pacearchaeota archaeon]|nr:hypothetical protein [Candidatus Pacearchaeota archaeon]